MTGTSPAFQGEANLTFNGTVLKGPARIAVTAASGDSKYRFNGDSATYAMGLNSSQTYGYLNSTAMTFTVDNVSDQGWEWRSDTDSASQGSMSLTQSGKLYVDDLINTTKVVLRSGGEVQSDGVTMRFTF